MSQRKPANPKRKRTGKKRKLRRSIIPIFAQCPRCHEELMDPDTKLDNLPSIRFHSIFKAKKGCIWLSAQYGSFEVIDELEIPDGEITTFFCTNCKEEIASQGSCDLCQAPLLFLDLNSGGRIEFCSRKGCKRHQLEFQKIEDLRDFYEKMHLDYSPAP